MAQLRPSVLYGALILGSVLAGFGLVFGLFYNSEKFEGNRYENSYEDVAKTELTAEQKTALTALQKKGIEWAPFRFIEAIKNDDVELVQLFINAGMPLNSNTILLEIALSASSSKKTMLALLVKHYHVDLNALYRLPNYVTQFDAELATIYSPYINERKEAFRLAMMVYKKEFVIWEQALDVKKQKMLKACTNDACRNGRINDVRRLYAESQPKKPELGYISKSRVFVSLLTIFRWQGDMELISYVEQDNAERIPNKMFLTDSKLIYFVVDASGNGAIIDVK